jgi:hypothetical protein
VRETTDQARSRRELRAQVGSLVQGEPDTPPGGTAVAAEEPIARPDPVNPVLDAGPGASTADRMRAAAGYPVRQQPWQDSFAVKAATGSSQTLSGWLYAVSPLWIGAMLIAGTVLLSIVNPLLVQAGLGVVGFALTFLLARQDIRRLDERGYRAPSAWWVLLPFFYFVVRMVRVGVRGVGMVVAYLVSSVALVGLLYLALIGNPALLSVITPSLPADSTPIPAPVVTLTPQERADILTPDGTEAELRLELAKTWDVGTIDCVPFPSTGAGTTTTCVVVLDNVAYNAGLEITPDEPGSAFLVTGMLPVD